MIDDRKSNSSQNWDLALAIMAATLLATALILNYYRYKFFGVMHHNASRNFWFNLTFFIPLTVTSVLLSLIVNLRIFFFWSAKANLNKKVISLLLTTPIIALFVLTLLRVIL